ncbi:MAG: hypothetical protein M3Z04_12845 [Chloroflexota bacterium]|nr:hypothetical protein [Chloroflexota bacterium]
MDETPHLPTPGEAEGDRAAAPTAPPSPTSSADPAAAEPTLPNPSQAEGEDA